VQQESQDTVALAISSWEAPGDFPGFPGIFHGMEKGICWEILREYFSNISWGRWF